MIRPTQLHHVSVGVTDLEKSRRFYAGLLGLTEIPKPSTFGFEVAWFELGDQHVHLLAQLHPDPMAARHFALNVESLEAAKTVLDERGVAYTEGTPIPGADRVFIHDPDGNLIELLEWSTPYPSAGA